MTNDYCPGGVLKRPHIDRFKEKLVGPEAMKLCEDGTRQGVETIDNYTIIFQFPICLEPGV